MASAFPVSSSPSRHMQEAKEKSHPSHERSGGGGGDKSHKPLLDVLFATPQRQYLCRPSDFYINSTLFCNYIKKPWSQIQAIPSLRSKWEESISSAKSSDQKIVPWKWDLRMCFLLFSPLVFSFNETLQDM